MTAALTSRTAWLRAVLGLVLVAGLLMSSAPVATPSSAQVPSAGQRPITIPGLQQWAPGSGTFSFGTGSTVVVAAADVDALRADAEGFAADLAAEVGSGGGVMTTSQRTPRPGDVLLELDSADAALGAEGYRLDIGQVLRISAPAAAGVFYGTQSVLQLAHQSAQVPFGVARDWPRYPFRGFMLDNGRKYYSPDWVKARIREIAYLKYNVLHLHFSDNQGFRIQSESHPEVVSQPALTKQEVREIIALAQRYHITVVPEIDSPGHMQAALSQHPELQITRSNGVKDPGNLNFIDPAARQFVRELLEEYFDLFPGPWWHIGGDEFVFNEADWGRYPQLTTWAKEKYGPDANHYDAFFDYINWLDDVVTCNGRASRMWSGHLGGKYVKLRPTIENEVWHRQTGFATPQQLLDLDTTILNSMYYPTYYVLLPQWYVRPDNKAMTDWYENWEPWEFDGDTKSVTPDTVAADDPRLTGGKFHVWSDSPNFRTQEEVGADISPRFRVMAQKLWFSPPLTPSWPVFTLFDNVVGQPPAVPPGVTADVTAAAAQAATAPPVPSTCEDEVSPSETPAPTDEPTPTETPTPTPTPSTSTSPSPSATPSASPTPSASAPDEDPTPTPTPTVEVVLRMGGPGRVETAIEVSQASFGNGQAGAAVLARADVFADALAGTPLAIDRTAPLLLTGSAGLDDAVAAELQRLLQPGATVFLLGGTAALSQAVADDVEALGFAVVRYGGANRFATAAVIADDGLDEPDVVLLASGATFPDAVSAGAAAGNVGGAVLLTDGSRMPAETQAYLDSRGDAATRTAVGGPAAAADPGATAVAGADRIATAVAVAERFFDDPTVVGVATAAAFADGLSGGAQVGRVGGPLLLTDTDAVGSALTDYLERNAASVSTLLIYGGAQAVSADVARDLQAAIG